VTGAAAGVALVGAALSAAGLFRGAIELVAATGAPGRATAGRAAHGIGHTDVVAIRAAEGIFWRGAVDAVRTLDTPFRLAMSRSRGCGHDHHTSMGVSGGHSSIPSLPQMRDSRPASGAKSAAGLTVLFLPAPTRRVRPLRSGAGSDELRAVSSKRELTKRRIEDCLVRTAIFVED